jgi:hypothetical protein
LENGKNIGMAQRRGRLGFLLKAAQSLRVKRNEPGQDLDGYIALQTKIAGSIHFPHAAGAKQRENLEVSHW